MIGDPKEAKKLRILLARAMHRDVVALRRELSRLLRAPRDAAPETLARQWAALRDRVDEAVARKRRRRENLPPVADLPHLPITKAKTKIIDTIRKHPVTIVSGETGSGKTTQLPKFCLAAGRGIDGTIACTQPRRLAATTVSARIAEELGQDLGQSVGYKIRFQDKTSPDGYIKVITDGILLAETQGDPWLNEYDTIIVDEAHERSLNIDFVLGILKRLVQRRRNLKLIITSATIDTQKFSKAFNDAPVIEVSGRLYPVKTRYFISDTGVEENEDRTPVDLATQAVDQLIHQRSRGDILVFMPTEQDIRETCELLEGRSFPNTLILPLFARLSPGEQRRVFASTAKQKIIVATNVAETSITIPGIKYVVDTGLARIAQYRPRSRTTALPVVPISRSSADQRKGRCGRVENGVCIRLFAQEDYLNRPLFTQPEILRSNLADVLLRMIALKLGDIAGFPFIDRPAEKSIRDGVDLLVELGAIRLNKGKKGQRFTLTQNGRTMARMPIDPRLSRMLMEARRENCVNLIAILAAALSIQDVRERPLDKEALADQAHRPFVDPLSDFITLLNIWNALHEGEGSPRSTGELKNFCKKNFLSFRRVREWRDIHRQIVSVLREQQFDLSGRGQADFSNTQGGEKKADGSFHPVYAALHRCILSGFLSNIAMRKEKVFYRAAKERDVMLFPGSGLFQQPGRWIVAAEMVETSRLFARIAAVVDVDWLEPLGGDLCRYAWSDPHWEKNRGEVVANEQVSLFGLQIVQNRKVAYGRIDPERSSDIFVRSALVEGALKAPPGFVRHNRQLVEEVRKLEDRIRRRDILVDDDVLVNFYKERLPGVHDLRTLNHWIRKRGGDRFLRLDRERLTHYMPDQNLLDRFPQQLDLGHRVLDCDYRFDPGKEVDGVTLTIPAEAAAELPRQRLEWLVPGLLEEKITALIKGLPKAYRVQLVPVAQTVRLVLDKMPQGRESLATALSRFLFEQLQVDIPAAAWPVDELPDHLKMRVAITDDNGRVLASGRDERLLQPQTMPTQLPSRIQALRRKWERGDVTKWNFGDLPEVITIDDDTGKHWRLYPGLSAHGKKIRLMLFTDDSKAQRAHREGVAALLSIRFAEDLRFLKKNLKLPQILKRQTSAFGGKAAVEDQLYRRVTQSLFSKTVRTRNQFEALVDQLSRSRIHQGGQDLRKAVIAVIEAHHEARCRIADIEKQRITAPVVNAFLQRLKADLSRLVPDTFVLLYDEPRLAHLVRYLTAISIRAQRGIADLDKDRSREALVVPFAQQLDRILQSLDEKTSREKRLQVETFFWMIEEYKISLFAQEVGTDGPISDKRLKKKMGEIERMV